MSITGFEKQTHELTAYEMTVILPKVVKQLKTKIGRKNAVTNKHVCEKFVEYGYQLTPPRFRKIIKQIIYLTECTCKTLLNALKQGRNQLQISRLEGEFVYMHTWGILLTEPVKK